MVNRSAALRVLIPCLLFAGWFQPVNARDVAGLFEAALADTSETRVEVYKTVGTRDLLLEVYEPPEGVKRNGTAVLWFHGGGWQSGYPRQLDPHCRYLASIGYVAVTALYRLAIGGQTVFDGVEDAYDAFYWIHENAGDLGIDPSGIVVAGESAGGHLAGCVGYIPDSRVSGIPLPQPVPRACILVNPIVDMNDPAISWALKKPGMNGDPVLGAGLSPLRFTGPDSPPALLLHGAGDTVVPARQSVDFAESLHADGVPANLRLWPGINHAFFLYLPPNLTDKPVIHASLLEIEAFLQAGHLNGYPAVHGHFAPVHLFNGDDGFRSFSELVDGGDGWLYGSTYLGGSNDKGLLFKFNPATRAFSQLRSFDGTDGDQVFNGLAVDGTRLYGVGKFGGDHGDGTLFAINTDGGGFEVLHHFNVDAGTGHHPHSAPVLVGNVLYGTAFHGGDYTGAGVLYRYPLPSGPYEVWHSFSPATGRHPTGQLLPLDGWLYGTASDFYQQAGGNHGSLYRINRSTGLFELLHSFDGASGGGHPYDDLFHDGNGKLIGTTFGEAGNPASKGTIFLYSISNDTLTILHDFAANPGTGSKPNGALIAIDSSGWLYGLAHGSNDPGGDSGTLFRLRMDGTEFTVLHVFESGLSGNTPMRSLVFKDGAFHGVSVFGGLTTDTTDPATGGGFIFSYSPVDNPSAARSALVDWLAGHGQPVNQRLDGNTDNDALTLIEEFTYGGHPDADDARAPLEFILTGGTQPRAGFTKVRAVMNTGVVPFTSADLDGWQKSAGFTRTVSPHPVDGPAFETHTYEWPAGVLDAGAFFLRFELTLDD